MSLLQKMNWIDRQTRAVVVEFSTYNPNINMIMVTTILLEFLEAGSILSTATYDQLNLFNYINGFVSFKSLSLLLIILFLVYFMANEIIHVINRDLKEYLTDFWPFIEWSIIVTAWISLIMSALRLNAANNVLSFFKATQGYAYINLQQVNLKQAYLI